MNKKDFEIKDNYIIVNEEVYGETELNNYFSKHKLITSDYTENDIEELIDSVAFFLDYNYGFSEEEYKPTSHDHSLMERFLGLDYLRLE